MKRIWFVPATLWIVIVAPSGSGKSPPLNVLTRPHWERDKVLVEITKQSMEECERRAAAAKKSTSSDHHHNGGRPPRKCIVIDDTTMEAIVERLADNPKGLILVGTRCLGCSHLRRLPPGPWSRRAAVDGDLRRAHGQDRPQGR